MSGFAPTPLDGSSPAIPLSSSVPDGTNTPKAVEGGPIKNTGGNDLAPVAVYQYDGYDVTQGTKADAAVIDPTASGTLIALLKGLLTELIDIEAQTTLTPVVSGTITEANSAAILANMTEMLADGDHLAVIDTNTANIPAKGSAAMVGSTPITIATNDTNFAELLTDTDNLTTIATNTNKIPASPAQESGNLASIKTDLDEIAIDTDNLAAMKTDLDTLSGIVSSSKAAVKSASGDFADGAITGIGTTTQAKATDGTTTSWSMIQLLKGIFDKLIGSIAVTGTFWQATQPVSGTVTETNSGSIKTDLDEIAIDTDNLAGIKTDLDTLSGIVSSSKAAVKAASGDFADGADVGIGTTTQTKATDGTTTSWSVIQLLKGIFDKLLGTLAVTQSGTWTVMPGNTVNTTPWLVAGKDAAGASSTVNPLQTGGIGHTALPTAVTDGQVTQAFTDRYGRTVSIANLPWSMRSSIPKLTITSDVTAKTLIALTTATFHHITFLLIANISATACEVDISDGTNTYTFEVPANGTAGASGAEILNAAAGTNWTATCGTSVASIIITGSYISQA